MHVSGAMPSGAGARPSADYPGSAFHEVEAGGGKIIISLKKMMKMQLHKWACLGRSEEAARRGCAPAVGTNSRRGESSCRGAGAMLTGVPKNPSAPRGAGGQPAPDGAPRGRCPHPAPVVSRSPKSPLIDPACVSDAGDYVLTAAHGKFSSLPPPPPPALSVLLPHT